MDAPGSSPHNKLGHKIDTNYIAKSKFCVKF